MTRTERHEAAIKHDGIIDTLVVIHGLDAKKARAAYMRLPAHNTRGKKASLGTFELAVQYAKRYGIEALFEHVGGSAYAPGTPRRYTT